MHEICAYSNAVVEIQMFVANMKPEMSRDDEPLGPLEIMAYRRAARQVAAFIDKLLLDHVGPRPEPQQPPKGFPDMGLDFNLSPTCSARVVIQGRDGSGWELQDLTRLLAALELQRSFIARDPLDVHVSVSTPAPATTQGAPT